MKVLSKGTTLPSAIVRSVCAPYGNSSTACEVASTSKDAALGLPVGCWGLKDTILHFGLSKSMSMESGDLLVGGDTGLSESRLGSVKDL